MIYAGAMYVCSSTRGLSSLFVSDTVVSDCTAEYSGAIHSLNGNVDMQSTQVIRCRSTRHGGAMQTYVAWAHNIHPTVRMMDVLFDGCETQDYGGALHLNKQGDDSSFHSYFTRVTFRACIANQGGGCAWRLKPRNA